MTSVIFVSLLLVAFEGAILLMLPHISPRRFLFAITVPQEFPSSEPGRNALRRYHWAVAAAIVLGAAAVLAFESRPQWTVCAVAIPCIGSLAAFLRERSHVRRIAGPVPDVREADLSGGDDRLPGWFALALPPFALPAAAALYLRSHWEDIPARFPIHWGIDGPDRWAEKSTHGVYGTLLSGAAMMLAFLLLTLVSFYGARRAPQREVMVKLMVAAIYMLACVFTAIGLQPLLAFPPLWVLVAPAVFLLVAIALIYRVVRDPQRPAEVTPDECWYLGGIYYNPQDPTVFVQKRFGFGYTFNFGSRWSWILTAVLVATPLAITVVMPR
ncbi:MAG TPA: DUF5808 domain-containing protein [Bryobacteraceae bacterium]|nr:DUF5808 domain-containing protein [Bryobacteraceae bacterium]